MVIKYDIEKIKTFLADFHNMTSLTISFWDADMNQLAFAPQEMQGFCSLIKSNPVGKKRCLICDKKLIMECKEKLMPITSKCHAGLIDTALPIVYKDQTLAFVLFGQAVDFEFSETEAEKILHLLHKNLSLPYSQLSDAFFALKRMEPYVIRSTANILSAATLQLLISKSICLSENELISRINEFLIANIHDTLSISILCEEFQISRNRLYSLWKKHFDITIGDYILRLRMEKAKNLLTNNDDKIYEICAKVGIPDYNYFSKLFKDYYGYSPREYKKRFPLILEESTKI